MNSKNSSPSPIFCPQFSHFSKQWGLHNTGQSPPGGTVDADIDAPEAWDIQTGSSDVKIGILDSGIPLQSGTLCHEDLANATRIKLGKDCINSSPSPIFPKVLVDKEVEPGYYT